MFSVLNFICQQEKGGDSVGFSNRLKEYRNKRGLTQQELAEKSDVSRATIVGIENGGVKVVKTDTLMKLSNALGYPVTRIFFTKNV